MSVRLSVALGSIGVALCAVLIGVLHAVAAADVNPIRHTISQYALGEFDWMFDVGVAGLAVGSALVLWALVRAGLLRWRSSAAEACGVGALGVWVVGLLVVIAFERVNWSTDPTGFAAVSGYIHRYASLAAFVALPVAAIAIGRRWRGDRQFGWFAAWARVLGAVSLGWLSTVFGAVLVQPFTGVDWWDLLPLGLVERGLAGTEVVAVAVLAGWAWRAGRTVNGAGPTTRPLGVPAVAG